MQEKGLRACILKLRGGFAVYTDVKPTMKHTPLFLPSGTLCLTKEWGRWGTFPHSQEWQNDPAWQIGAPHTLTRPEKCYSSVKNELEASTGHQLFLPGRVHCQNCFPINVGGSSERSEPGRKRSFTTVSIDSSEIKDY